MICETCGKSFAPPERAVEVSTARTLCAECLAAYQASKRSKVRPEGAGSAARPAAGGRPADAPPPAPAQPVRAQRPPPPPPAQPARTQRPPPEASAQTVRAQRPPSEARRETRPSAPEKPSSRRPAEDRSRRASGSDRKTHLGEFMLDNDTRSSAHASRATRLGLQAALGLGVIAIAVAWFVIDTKEAEAEGERARAERRNQIHQAIMEWDISNEESARKLVAYSEQEDTTSGWRNDPKAADSLNRIAQARSVLESFELGRKVLQDYDVLAVRLSGVENLTSEEISKLTRELENMVPRASDAGPGFAQTLTTAIATASGAYGARLVEEARKLGADPSSGVAAMAAYTKAEEEVKKRLDVAYRAWEKAKDNPVAQAEKKRLEDLYKALIRESDAAATALYTDSYIEGQPWVDLLSGDRAGQWTAAAVQGFSHSIQNGAMRVVGPDASAGAEGILSIGDRDKWRDFQLETSITLKSGQTDLYLRLGMNPVNVEHVTLSVDGDGAVASGEPVEIAIRFVGSRWTCRVSQAGQEPAEPAAHDAGWTAVRRGAVGLGVPAGTEFTITKMRIKVLR